MYDFGVGFVVWVEVGVVFVVVDVLVGECVFEDLFEVEEFDD